MWNVSKNKEILDFKCNKFEVDTFRFSIYYNIRSTDNDTMVVTDAEDTESTFIKSERPIDLVQ